MMHERVRSRERRWYVALASIMALFGAFLVAGGSPLSAVPPPTHPSTGYAETCVLDAASSCTLDHRFDEKPSGIQAVNGGPSIVSVDPNQTTDTHYRIVFTKHDGTLHPAGTTARFYVHFDFDGAAPDRAAPDTDITAGPSDTVATGDAEFAFTANEAGVFECKLDAGSFVPCTSPKAYTGLADGPHTFEVRATDTAGNVDPTPASRAWSIDTTPPNSTITSGPANGQATSGTVEFTSEAGATFECQLDADSVQACTSPVSLSGLSVGSHTFRVWATDAEGNRETTPATHTWEVTAPPAPSTKPEMGGAVWQPTQAQEWAAFESAMGASENRRCYENAIPASFAASCGGINGDYAAGRETWISFKPTIVAGGLSATSLNQLRTYLRSVPADHELVATVWHEPENDMGGTTFAGSNPAQRQQNWLAAQRQAGAVVDEINAERGPSSKLRYSAILMGYWTFDTRGYSAAGTNVQNWRNLTAADFANVDIIGFDPYKINPGDPSMEAMMTRDNSGSLTSTGESAMANAVSWGKTIAFPEWGCTSTNFSDANRASWITAAYNWAKAWNVANPNNRLTDLTYFHVDNFAENGSVPQATWEVVGDPLSEAALRNAFADSRN